MNDAPIVLIKQQESRFLAPAIAPTLACVGGSWEVISKRTTAALAAAKARGKQLGTPDPAGTVERMRAARKALAA